MIVAQSSPSHDRQKRHDRTGHFISRPKMTVELAQSINDGLYFYEQVCNERSELSKWNFVHENV